MIKTRPATTAHLELRPMLIVDCPLCDAPAPYDADAGTLDCPACAIRLGLADDAPVLELAAAA